MDEPSSAAQLARRVASLETRLARAEAVHAIHNLKARYAELVDRRYTRGRARESAELAETAEAIAALFTEDGVWDGGPALGRCEGREAIAARMREPTLLFSWHFFVKPHVEVDGDRARARWDILSPCTTRDGRPHWMVGTEDDEYTRVGDAWLHRSMHLRTVFLAPHDRGWEKIFV